MKMLVLAFLLLSHIVSAAECLNYGKELKLAGSLSRETFSEKTDSQLTAAGDQPASYFFISVGKTFCVSAKEVQPAEIDVQKIQLVFPAGKDAYAPLRPYIGSKVECDGELFHATSENQQTQVLLSDARCRPSF